MGPQRALANVAEASYHFLGYIIVYKCSVNILSKSI